MENRLLHLIKKLNNIGLRSVWGAELEFYIVGKSSQELIKAISTATGLEIQQEKGNNQYEVATDTFHNAFDLINYIKKIKEKISCIGAKYCAGISFNPKPFPNDYGSAMHIHLSLVDQCGLNIFNHYKKIEDNKFLLYSIGGILHNINDCLYMIIGEDKYELERLHSSYMAPSTVSWGKNNRTTAIRIPDSHPYNRNRRIEFRVPSASSDIYNCIIFLLTSVIYGIKNKILPGKCIYGNANDTTYNLISLHKSLNDMRKAFFFEEIFDLTFR